MSGKDINSTAVQGGHRSYNLGNITKAIADEGGGRKHDCGIG
jgi:hypothetical protein